MNAAATAVWARPALVAQAVRRRRDGHAEVGLHVPALTEARAALRLEQALAATVGVTRSIPDIVARRLRVHFDDRRVSLADLLAVCAAAGCAAEPVAARALDDARVAAHAASLRYLLVAGVFAMQAMSFALVLYLGAGDDDATTSQLFRWLGFLSALPVVAYAAQPFHRHAWAALRAHRVGIDVPVAIAILAIFTASAVNAIRGSGEVYFDSVSMFVFVLLIGRHLELRARHRHRADGEAAADATPLVATRRNAAGELETVAASELVAGDLVHVAEGCVVPVDGVMASAAASLDEALLTGEARAVAHRRGDTIAAGALVSQGPLELRATHAANEGTAARLAALAGAVVTPWQTDANQANYAARRFVQRVLMLAVATTAFWLWRDPARAFDATIAVIVVACPCAFGLAAPAALTRAMSVLSRLGVLVAKPSALVALTRGGHALFDKTGTLTEPTIDSAAIKVFGTATRDAVIALAATLGRASSHPLSRAAARLASAGPAPTATDITVIAGAGVEGRLDGQCIRLGRAGFATAAADDGALWLAREGVALARFAIREQPRADADATIQALRAHGFTPTIASGDDAVRVADIARTLGLEAWHARETPADKLARVHAWQRDGSNVLAVGDGSNDAPALAAADVSATLAGGTDLARCHADLLLRRGLGGLASACTVAGATHTVVTQNRRWALVYNLAAIPFAAAGLVPPWLAAIGMGLSSLMVVLNSLRIRAPEGTP